MGIDIYMEWENQTQDEKESQYTGYSITSGEVGYLREAYHGGPYATRFFVAEAFGAPHGARIDAETLYDRLPATVLLSLYRHAIIYEGKANPVQSFKTKEVDQLAERLCEIFEMEIPKMIAADDEIGIVEKIAKEQYKQITKKIKDRALPDYALAFVDFADLAQEHQNKTGKPITIHASY